MNEKKQFNIIKNSIFDVSKGIFEFQIWKDKDQDMTSIKSIIDIEAISSDCKTFLILVNKPFLVGWRLSDNKYAGYTIVDAGWNSLIDWLFSSAEFFDDIVVLRKDIDNTNWYIAIYDISSGVRLIHDKKTNIANKDSEIVTIVTWWKYKWTTSTIECEKGNNTINLFNRSGKKLWQMDISNNNYFQEFLRETTFWRIWQSYKIENNFDLTIEYWVTTKFSSNFRKKDIMFKLPEELKNFQVISCDLKKTVIQSNWDIILISEIIDDLGNSNIFVLDNKWSLITTFESKEFWIDIPLFNILWGWIYCSHMLDAGKYWKFLPQTVLWIGFKDLKRWLFSVDWETYFDQWGTKVYRLSLYEIEYSFKKVLQNDDNTITINWKKFNKKLLKLN